MRIIILLHVACLLLPLGAAEVAIETVDGRTVAGALRQNGKALVVSDGIRDVHLTPASVLNRREVELAQDEELNFVFNQELVDGKKRGTVGMVVDQWAWGDVDQQRG